MARKRKNDRHDRVFNFDNLSAPELLRRWQVVAAKRIYGFAKRTFPLRKSLWSGRYLFINDNVLGELTLTGIVPNISDIKGFGAPINKFEKARRHVFLLPHYGFRTLTKKRGLGSAGVMVRTSTEYYGGEKASDFIGFYGLGKPTIGYGMTPDSKALPAYYRVSVPEFLADEQKAEVDDIIKGAFETVMGKKR